MAENEKLSQICNNFPRVMIAGTKSGSGKTTLTCALLQVLKDKGKRPVSFKCGPDFIDPMFHQHVLNIPSTNLDSFFLNDEEVRKLFEENITESNADCAVIEGVMGLYDGIAGKSLKGSSYDIAKITGTPIILCIDAKGMSRSIVPLINGFLEYDKVNSEDGKPLIKGVFLNKVSKGQFLLLKSLIEEECKIKVAGYFSEVSEYVLKSRHLGLFLPHEIQELSVRIKNAADFLSESLDLDCVFQFRDKITTVRSENVAENSSFPPKIKIAVARDEAFCFYYQENLKLLEKMGAELKFFSPLTDSALPSDVSGLLLGGGYPELYAQRLQENLTMRSSIKSACKNGISVMAECGGFMYLQERIKLESGDIYEMCGGIEGESFYTGKLVRFGYADFIQNENAKLSIKGHEFHYFDSTNNGTSFTAKKPLSSKSWSCIVQTPKILAGFPHLYYRSNPQIVNIFLESCKKG